MLLVRSCFTLSISVCFANVAVAWSFKIAAPFATIVSFRFLFATVLCRLFCTYFRFLIKLFCFDFRVRHFLTQFAKVASVLVFALLHSACILEMLLVPWQSHVAVFAHFASVVFHFDIYILHLYTFCKCCFCVAIHTLQLLGSLQTLLLC